MKVQKTKLENVFLIQPQVFEDKRGYFFESFNKEKFKSLTNLDCNFVQDNQSCSQKDVLRGLHFQNPPYAQAKLVSVVKGAVLDVAVDIRKKSTTYGQFIIQELNENNHSMLYLPEGIAHGFLTLENDTIFSYKCSDYYEKNAEDCLLWKDPLIGIDWSIKNPILSKKDLEAKNFSSFVSPF